MKIAIYNCFAGEPLAESGLSRRISLAAKNLGWSALETHLASEINDFNPDFVLALHFFTPKLTRHPTYGCMWSPPSFFEHVEIYLKNVFSYDGFLSSSPAISKWLEEQLQSTGKPYFIAPFYTSCHSVKYEQPDFSQARLLYAGTNWDGFRFQELFHQLDLEPYMEVYGPKQAWHGLRRSYKGLIPIDGTSILSELRRAGAGLCLHRPEHCEAGTPSLRIFEIAASGAVAICQEHPFIRGAFGDSVLYLKSLEDIPRAAAEVSEHMQWIRSNPDSAAALSRRAHAVFSRNFTFEQLLAGVLPHHELQSAPRASAVNPDPREEAPMIDVLIFAKKANADELCITLEGICRQGARIRVLLISDELTPELKQAAESFCHKIFLRSEVLPERKWIPFAIAQTSCPYFAILQPGEVWFSNHVHSLLQSLESDVQAQFAYSGAVRINRDKPRAVGPFITQPDRAELGYFELPTSRPKVPRDLVVPSCILARRKLLDDVAQAPHAIGSPMALLFYVINSGHGKFTYQATMSYQTRPGGSRFARASRARELRKQLGSSSGTKMRLEFSTDVQDQTPPIHRRMLQRLQRFFS